MVISSVDVYAFMSTYLLIGCVPVAIVSISVVARKVPRTPYLYTTVGAYLIVVFFVALWGYSYGAIVGIFDAPFRETSEIRLFHLGFSFAVFAMIAGIPAIIVYTSDKLRLEKALRKDIQLAQKVSIEKGKGLMASRLSLKYINKSLEQAQIQQSEFIANVSHELRTPLSVILGYAELGSMENNPHVYWGTVLAAGGRIRFLVDNILGSSALESGKTFTQECFNLTPIVYESILGMNVLAEKRNVSLKTSASEPHSILGSEPLILLALNNLINNAILFNVKGGRIVVSVTATADYVALAVTDTGIGITDETRLIMFDRFAQGDGSDTRVVPGVGLGLHFVKLIAEAHSAIINVVSEIGKGTTFTLFLPIGECND